MDSTNLFNLSQNFQILSVPTDDDDLQTTAQKLVQLAEHVKQGHSLALWTGSKLVPEAQNPEILAVEQMTPQERIQYEEWKRAKDPNVNHADSPDHVQGYEKIKLPNFLWDEYVAPIPQGQQSFKKFTQRAAAMDIVFEHHGATPEHASWLTFNMAPILPLVKAVTKVLNMKTHLQTNYHSAMPGLSDMEVLEVKTIRRIVAAAERNRTRELEKIRRLTRMITDAAEVLKARAQSLEK